VSFVFFVAIYSAGLPMPYPIQLLDRTTILDELLDRENWLESWAFHLPSDSSRLAELDPSGDTFFNRIQSLRLLEEVQTLQSLTHTAPNNQQAFLIRLHEILERCRDSDHYLVLFKGH
jgi:hypothetical protein